jgi:hypothetical protein
MILGTRRIHVSLEDCQQTPVGPVVLDVTVIFERPEVQFHRDGPQMFVVFGALAVAEAKEGRHELP